jgi:hypothetical protein
MANIERFIGPLGVGSVEDIQALIDGPDPSYLAYSATGGYDNGKCVQGAIWWTNFYLNYASAGKTKVVGFWVRNAQQSEYSSDYRNGILQFNGPDIRIYNTPSGFDIRRGTTQIATDSYKITTGLTHVEVKVYSHSSAGTVEIKINGVSVYSGTGLNTDGADITKVTLCSSGAGNSFQWSGIFIADDWVGALIPKLLTPNGDDSKQLTPSAGSDNYAMVDETAQDGDSTYVQSNTAGHKDIYTFSDLETGFTPKVISLVMIAKEADAGGKGMKILSVQDSTERTHKTVSPLPANYPSGVAEGIGSVATLDACPDATALSRTKLNALKFGVEVV